MRDDEESPFEQAADAASEALQKVARLYWQLRTDELSIEYGALVRVLACDDPFGRRHRSRARGAELGRRWSDVGRWPVSDPRPAS